VLKQGQLPFHSLAGDVAQAVEQARVAQHRAETLLQQFGGKQELRAAVRNTPWYLLSKPEDIQTAGLCDWGVSSFLSRVGLKQIAFSVGLPRVVLRLAGPYGDRLTASALLRKGSAHPPIPYPPASPRSSTYLR
jgi:hypothetical protein